MPTKTLTVFEWLRGIDIVLLYLDMLRLEVYIGMGIGTNHVCCYIEVYRGVESFFGGI